MLRIALLYGSGLALGAMGLSWVESHFLVRSHPIQMYAGIVALGFLGLGIWAGVRLARRSAGPAFVVNRQAQSSLGISEREFEVLELLARGSSNKQIAQRLKVSPNTVKTHVARLYEKLDVQRRTEAVLRARELGMVR
jgi:DNA-binding CsgD family transcriptional regulator